MGGWSSSGGGSASLSGTVTGSLVPNSNDAYDLGSSSFRFYSVNFNRGTFADNVSVNGAVCADYTGGLRTKASGGFFGWYNNTVNGGSVGVYDTSLFRVAAKVVGIFGNSGTQAGVLSLPGMAVSALPTAATATAGALATVTDATVTTAGTTVVGGGSSLVTVRSDGTNWKIMF